jgi:hypothetical protein
MEWRAVVGFEGLYEVSSTGRIRSLDRQVRHWTGSVRTVKGRELKPCRFKAYLRVTLSRDGMYQSHNVHKIVAAAFRGPRPLGYVTRHKDGDGTNNRWKNVTYGTPADNSADRMKHGNAPRGEGHALAKLTDAKVRRIRKLLLKFNSRQVAEMFDMSNQQISNIKLRKAWAHVE